MVQDPLHDVRAHVLSLVRRIDDDVPDGGAIHVIGQDPTAPDKPALIPRRDEQIGLPNHVRRLGHGSPLSPERLLEQGHQEGRVKILMVGIGDHVENGSPFVLH